MCQLASSQVPRILLTWNYFCKNWISIDYFQRDITLCRDKMSQLCFRILRVGRKGFYMAGIYFSWKPNAEPLWSAKYSKNNVFKFWRTIFNYDVINQNAYVPSFLVRQQIADENFIFISFLYQELWVIQFYQVLYGNYWEFEMSDWWTVSIARMINSKVMKFSNTFQIEIC